MHTLLTDRNQLVNDLLHLITATSGSNYISCNNSIITNWGNGLDGVSADGNKSILQSLELEAIYKPQVQGDQENELEAVQKEYYETSFFASQYSNSELIFGCSLKTNETGFYHITISVTDHAGNTTTYSQLGEQLKVTTATNNNQPSTITNYQLNPTTAAFTINNQQKKTLNLTATTTTPTLTQTTSTITDTRLYIDNTPPTTSRTDTTNIGWGNGLDGIFADGNSPEISRLTDGYITRNNTLTISSTTEKGSRLEIWINNNSV